MMNPIVEGWFTILREDLQAARRLADCVPRASAYHLQQAAEKLVKAILAAEGLHTTAEHHIGQLVGKLPDGHEWKADLAELDRLSRYGTAYRYPTPAGRVAAAPAKADLDAYADLIATLADDAREWCGERA